MPWTLTKQKPTMRTSASSFLYPVCLWDSYIAASNCSVLVLLPQQCSTARLLHNPFLHSTADGHWSCFCSDTALHTSFSFSVVLFCFVLFKVIKKRGLFWLSSGKHLVTSFLLTVFESGAGHYTASTKKPVYVYVSQSAFTHSTHNEPVTSKQLRKPPTSKARLERNKGTQKKQN